MSFAYFCITSIPLAIIAKLCVIILLNFHILYLSFNKTKKRPITIVVSIFLPSFLLCDRGRSFFWKPFFWKFVRNRSTRIGGPRASLFQLFFAFLTWPYLTCLNRSLSPFFHHLTPPGWPPIWQFFSEFQKMDMERRGGGGIIEIFLAFLTWPNLTCWSITLIPSFIT